MYGRSYLAIENSVVTSNMANDGGGLFAQGFVTISGTYISANRALSNGGGIAAAPGSILSMTLDVFDTTVASNRAGAAGGGVYLGQDFENIGSFPGPDFKWVSASFANVTIAGNEAAEGGGVASAARALDLLHVTVTENRATTGSGLALTQGAAAEEPNVTNSIVALNQGAAQEIEGQLTLMGGNIVGDEYLLRTDAGIRSTAIDATRLFAGGLLENGGSVPTIRLLSNPLNPALDAGEDALAPPTDARGELRPVNLPGIANNGTNASDLGAFEVQGLEPELHVVVVRAAGTGRPGAEKANNAPIFELRVDGETIGRQLIENPQPRSPLDTGDDSLFRDYAFSFSGDAADRIEVVYLNDGKIGRLDKNLYVDHVTVDGRTLESEEDGFFMPKNGNPKFAGATEELFVNGTLVFELSETLQENGNDAPDIDLLM
jgi:Ca-dependent carbohydrate-binding module xylan-binding